MTAPQFIPGGEALIKGSFEVVTVKAVSDEAILVTRAGSQWAYSPDQLEPLQPDSCPIN
jgi:hypothetical protein